MEKPKVISFLKFLESTSLEANEKENIKFLIDFLEDKHIPELANKTYLFYGDPGLGKTFLIERFLEITSIPILFIGNFKLKNAIKFKSLDGLKKEIEKYEEFIVFLDDLDCILKTDEVEDIIIKDKQNLIALLELIKRSKNKNILICTTNDICLLNESILDRIEVKIEFNLPNEENKKEFLNKSFNEFIDQKHLEFISNNSIGYNYRDIPEIVKLAYREGNRVIDMNSIKKALQLYKPSSLMGYNIINGIDLKFKDLIGNEPIKKELNKVIIYYKNKNKFDELGIKRNNLLIFHGPVGTGKTYFAKAFAGELDFPIINIKARHIFRGGNIIRGIAGILHDAKRFRNCIIFIDEADKLFGKRRFEDDILPFADIHSELDGIEKNSEAIIILAMNDIDRFGEAIKDRFLSIKFDFPNYDDRREFLRRKLTKAKINKNFNFNMASRYTDGLSYREIEKIWNNCIFHYMANKRLNINSFIQFLKELKEENKLNYFG